MENNVDSAIPIEDITCSNLLYYYLSFSSIFAHCTLKDVGMLIAIFF